MDENTATIEPATIDYVALTAELVSAYVANNSVPGPELVALIASTHTALTGLGEAAAPSNPAPNRATPAQIRKSIHPDALISFEDGKPYKTLRRHLTKLGTTPEAYREKWGLPRDYPMVTASYSEQRSALAKSAGLGSRRRNAVKASAADAEPVMQKPKRAARGPETRTRSADS